MFKIRKIANSSDAASLSHNALDLESDNVPQQFKCPVCFELPLEEVFQCSNGHFVCKTCCAASCPQCRSPMALINGTKIRCRALEDILDTMLIACPFKKNGCSETFARGMAQAHIANCTFDGNCVRLCRYLHAGIKCDHWTRVNKPLEAVEHQSSRHNGISKVGPATSIDFPDFPKWFSRYMTSRRSVPHGKTLHIKAIEGHFLIGFFANKMDRTICFVGIRLDKTEQEVKNEVEFKIESTKSGVPTLQWKTPVTFALNSAFILEHHPIRVAVSELEQNYLNADDTLEIKISISQ